MTEFAKTPIAAGTESNCRHADFRCGDHAADGVLISGALAALVISSL